MINTQRAIYTIYTAGASPACHLVAPLLGGYSSWHHHKVPIAFHAVVSVLQLLGPKSSSIILSPICQNTHCRCWRWVL